MEEALAEIFDQARNLVADVDRKLAAEKDRQREIEREARLMEMSARIEGAFDFTSKEKLELDPRLDLKDGTAVVEFIVRSLRAIFVLTPVNDQDWNLTVVQEGREPQDLGEFKGGTKADSGSRRLAAARIISAIGNWSQKIPPGVKKSSQSEPARWQNGPEKREPTYGTMGKFLGY